MDEKLIDFVLSFASEMNQLENKYALLLPNTEDTASIFNEFLTAKQDIISTYLTERKNRVISCGFATPAQYSELSISNRIEVTHINPTRTEIFFYTDANGSLDYQFTLLLKNGEWKINSYKTKVHIAGRTWQNRSF